MDKVIEILVLLSVSATKFFFAPGISTSLGYNFAETLIITSSGGILGVIVFYYFGEFIFRLYDRFSRKLKRNRSPKVFSRKNKLIVKVKSKWGLIGLAIITPVLLSIPVGSFIAARFFNTHQRTLATLIISVILWSTALTTASQIFL